MFRSSELALVVLFSMVTAAEASAAGSFRSWREAASHRELRSSQRESVGSLGRAPQEPRHEFSRRSQPAQVRSDRILSQGARLASEAASRNVALVREGARGASQSGEQPMRTLRHCDSLDPVAAHPWWRVVCASYSITASDGI
jgi:hypothetical protein